MTYITISLLLISIAILLVTRSVKKSAICLEHAGPIQKDFLDAAEVLISDDRTPDIVADMAYTSARITQFRLVCLLWIYSNLRDSDGGEYYDVLEESVNSMDDQLVEQFHKLLGSFVLYATLRAGFLGTIVRRLVAPYVRLQGHEYKAATSGMDLAVGLVSVRPIEAHTGRAA